MLNKSLNMTLSELILIVILTHVIMYMMDRVNVNEFIKAMVGSCTYYKPTAQYGLHE
jgi:hypothetical protein